MHKTIILLLCCAVLTPACMDNGPSPRTIIWWHFWTDRSIKPVIEEMVRDFETGHPGIKVELVDLTWADGHDKIAIAFSSGTGPDVVELGSDWIYEFSSTNHLLDLSSRTEAVRDSFFMWEPAIGDGKVYAFPWILGTRVLFANRDLLTKAGYPADYLPQSWNDLLESSTTIRRLPGDFFGFGSNSAERHRLYKKFLPFMWARGGSILSPDGATCTFDSPATIEALDYYLKLCATGLTDTQRRLEDFFIDGRLGYVISGDWLLKRIMAEKPDFPLATFLLPGPEGLTSSVSFAGGEYLAINKATADPELAYALVEHIVSVSNQLRFCLENKSPTPSSKAAAADPALCTRQHFRTFIDQLKTSKTVPAHAKWVYIEALIERAVEEALYGTKTSRQAVADAADEIRRVLAEP